MSLHRLTGLAPQNARAIAMHGRKGNPQDGWFYVSGLKVVGVFGHGDERVIFVSMVSVRDYLLTKQSNILILREILSRLQTLASMQ